LAATGQIHFQAPRYRGISGCRRGLKLEKVGMLQLVAQFTTPAVETGRRQALLLAELGYRQGTLGVLFDETLPLSSSTTGYGHGFLRGKLSGQKGT